MHTCDPNHTGGGTRLWANKKKKKNTSRHPPPKKKTQRKKLRLVYGSSGRVPI
jgi:hypothetical protein